jgi:phospholipid/cholesterol/gamma-HCH transport system substrate-binding protein
VTASPSRAVAAPLIKFSIFAIVTILATLLLAATIGNFSFASTNSYRAVFTDVTGVTVGDDVRIAGVRVGAVTGIAIKDRTEAELTFTVSTDHPLFTSTHAEIRWRDLVGERYLALVDGAGDETRLQPGGEIPLAQTAPALDLTVLFQGFKPLFAALSPDDVNKLAFEIIQTLQGEGGTIDGLLSETASLTSALADRDQLIGSVIDNLNGVLTALDQHNDRFGDLLNQLQRLISGLSQDRQAIGSSLGDINALAAASAGLLDQARPAISTDLSQLTTLTGTINKNEKTVQSMLTKLPPKLDAATNVGDYGSWFNFFLCDFDGKVVLPVTGQTLTPDFHTAQARCGG